MALMNWATHMHMVMTMRRERKAGANYKHHLIRIVAATRLHEVGIASNRRSARYGEYVPSLHARHILGVDFI